MEHIATVYDLSKGLTPFKVVGKMSAADFVHCLSSHYRGSVTLLNLWDATEADLSAIDTADVEALAYFSSLLALKRKGGKTAVALDSLLGCAYQ